MDFKWDISRQVPSYTEPKFYTVSNNSHSVEKTSNPSCIYNVECSPAKKNTDWFTFTMKIDKASKHDAWNSLGIIECAPGKRTHARQSGGCVVRLDQGSIYVKGALSGKKLSRAIAAGDIIRVTHNPSSNIVTFQLNQETPVFVTHTWTTQEIVPVFAARAQGWKCSLLPSFVFVNKQTNMTRPSLYALTEAKSTGLISGFLSARKNSQDNTIYNVPCHPAQNSNDFSFSVKFTALVKSDQYNAIGIVASTHNHLRVKEAVCMRLDNGNVYVNGKPTSTTLAKVNVNDVVKVSFDSSKKRVHFRINGGVSKSEAWPTACTFPLCPAVATRAVGNSFRLEQGGSTTTTTAYTATTTTLPATSAARPMTWNTTKNNSSSKAEVYTVTGNVVEKTTKNAYIYNIESDPCSSAFKFQIKVLATKNHDPFNSIGVRNPKIDKHLRCGAGACVQLQTGKIWVNGSQYSSAPAMGAVTAGMTVTVSYTPGRVDFAYSNGRTASANWTSTSGDACPALAARALGWKFEGHWLQYGGSTYVPRPTTTSVKYKWQFEDGTKGSGQWKDYIPSDQTMIERAYLAKQNTMVISNKWGKYDVNNLQTASPSQKSQKTGWVRPMRRVPVGGSSTTYTPPPAAIPMKWQFENGSNGSNSWADFLPADSAKVEAAFKSRQSTLTITNTYGTYILSNLLSSAPIQKNTKTNAIRRLRRVNASVKPVPTTTTTTPAAVRGVDDPPPLPPSLRKIATVEVQSKDDIGKLGQMFVQMMTKGTGPSHWSPMGSDSAILVKLDPKSDEYRDALFHFRKSSNKRMVKIERVQNRYLWQEFLSTKMQIAAKNKGEVNQRVLFHGTRNTIPNKIWEGKNASGFDPRLGRGYYGVGAYFAQLAKYSVANYSYNAGQGQRQLFLAAVLCGDTKVYGMTKAQSLKRAPDLPAGHKRAPGLYDSVQGGPHDGSIMYIVYEGSQAYPLYLYTYLQ